MTPIKNSVRMTTVVVGAVYTVVLFLSGIKLDSWEKQLLAALPTIAAAAVVLFDRWVWKIPRLLTLHHRPRLDGIWRATLTPHPSGHVPDGGKRGPFETYVVIEQSFWSIAITQFTDESNSYSRTSTFLSHGQSSQRTLSFLYDNEPRLEHRERSPRHVGACEITTPQGVPTHLEGYYFTDRFTQGEMTLDLIDRSTNFVDFTGAKTYAESHQ